jgi:serine protease Do
MPYQFRAPRRMAAGQLARMAVTVAVAWLVAMAGPALAAALPAPAPVAGFADLVARVAPAVVNVSTKKDVAGREELPMPQFPPGSPFEEFFKEFFDRNKQQQPPGQGQGQEQGQDQPQRRSFSLGSGFVIDPAGYVVTNNHVIADADEITVIFSNDSEYTATIVGRDTKTDLALLKITRDEPFPFVEWADSDQVRVGDWMVAIGNPFGLGSSVTAGIVSARGRDIRAGPYDDFIQVDAAINRGNSGGPSFDLDGKVFGINTAIFSPSGGNVGIGFAIPANLAKPVIDSLKASGRVARGWLGVRIQTVTEQIAESLGLPDSEGALVAGVTPGGPAAKSDIQPGDVILQFDNKKIDRMRNLPRIVAETPIGRDSEVTLWRKGEKKLVHVVLGELPDDEQLAELGQTTPNAQPTPSSAAKIEDLGLTVRPIDADLKSQYNLAEGARGVVIVEVDPQSVAAQENLRPGDLVVEVGQEEVNSPPEVAAKVKQAREDGKKSVLLLVDRQGDLRFVALRFVA